MAVLTPRQPARILVVDDEESQRTGLAMMLRGWGFATDTAADGTEALAKLAEQPADAIVTDLMMPGVDGAGLLKAIRERGLEIPVIVCTAFGNVEMAVNTIRDLGAFWFMEKPIQPPVLREMLNRAVSQRRLSAETERLQRQLSYIGHLGQLAGTSHAMQRVFSMIRQIAPSKAAVLATGESGTGKELVARAIHDLSPRRNGPFVAVNCAAMPETLMESELFGHEKGAFTGAVERREGCFELAQDGTLLLDEIGDMPVGTQAKLLRVLEDSHIRRLAGKKEIFVDVRIIASTNKNLEAAIKKGAFREDLFYRLNVIQIALPPLRDRLEDLPALTEAIVTDLNRKHGSKVEGVHPDVLACFKRHNWPGNVRELRNILERALILAGSGLLSTTHLPAGLGGAAGDESTASAEADSITFRPGTTIDQAEKALIQFTLRHTRNNKTRAAVLLGISQKTMFNKLKEYGESIGEFAAGNDV
jgi:DNA-binding NtrC family response regulator